MDWLAMVFLWEATIILVALATLVVYKGITGRINLVGLLRDKETNQLSPGRVQLLVLTLVGAGTYLTQVAQAPPATLPEFSEETLGAVAVSQGLYLSGKSLQLLRRRFFNH
jgi:hypothetical protein